MTKLDDDINKEVFSRITEKVEPRCKVIKQRLFHWVDCETLAKLLHLPQK